MKTERELYEGAFNLLDRANELLLAARAQHEARLVYTLREMPRGAAEVIKASKMDAKHDHLNAPTP